MNILHINSYFSTSGLFKQLFDRQINAGLDLSVYVPISHQYPDHRLAVSGDYAYIARTFPQWTRWVFPLKHQLIWKDLKKRYPLSDFDLVHAHSLFSNGWLAQQVYRQYGVPYIVAVRNADLHTFFERMPWMHPLGLSILRDAQQIIFISQNTYQEVFDHFIPEKDRLMLEQKTQVIANGIDDYWHQHAYTHKKADLHTPLRIVSAGKVMPGKRFLEMAESCREFSQTYGPIEVHIAGPNWDSSLLEKLTALDHVIYHGPLNKEEMVNLYRQMDIFALLSFPETFGLVYPEAMSQGLPVIYTQNEGFDSFFPNYQVGVSVNRFDQEAFHQAILYICDHYETLSSNALKAIQSFKWDEISQHYLDLYHQIVDRKN